MSLPTEKIPDIGAGKLPALLKQLNQVILGKDRQLRLALACMLARGHLLIEDLPGMGKTTLAHALAATTGLDFNRIQFTSDMLPADIIGVSVFQPEQQNFKFHPGPVFSQVVLADEINRATPKAQSALLEAMEEHQISVDGTTHALPEPFFVIATQNPRHLVGTFPLPESQLDRFLFRIEMGYPGRKAEHELLKTQDPRMRYRNLQPVIDSEQLSTLQAHTAQVNVSDALLEYVQDLLAASRNNPDFYHGLSPRAGLGLVQAARAWAFLQGRDMVLPEDIQVIAPSVMNHRLQPVDNGRNPAELVEQLIESVPIP